MSGEKRATVVSATARLLSAMRRQGERGGRELESGVNVGVRLLALPIRRRRITS